MAWKYNPFTNQLDKTAEPLEEKISHADLDDMPDTGGSVTDHDTRYYTESEVDALFAAFTHTNLNGMPDSGGTVADHDSRYYTETETDNLFALYLKLDATNDPLTSELFIHPDSGTNALKVSKNITIKAGQKLIFDG